MAELRRHEKLGRNRYFSVSRKLRKEGKSSEEFEARLSTLTLEDVIALRLELAARLTKGKIHGLLCWKHLPDIIKDACIKAALSVSSTRKDAVKILGISERNFKRAVKKYESINFFLDETDR
jgi:hypothetical protein